MDSGTQLQQPNLQNEETFNLIFRTYYSSLASFAKGYVEEKETAEEIVQDVFTRIWENADSIEIRTSIKSYLYGAVRFACLNVLKHEKTRKKYLDRQQTTQSPDAIDFLELDELQGKIGQGMDKLPEKCRVIFELSRYEGMKYQEIADRLQLSIKTVENQMGKALKILREELAEYLPILILFVSDMGVNQSFIVELLQR